MNSEESLFQVCQNSLKKIKESQNEMEARTAVKSLQSAFAQINEKKIQDSNVRNFRVLIILGCNVSLFQLPFEVPLFLDSGIFSVAFLYKHLFKYLYNFTDDQILITNIGPGVFQTYSKEKIEISPKRTGYYRPNSDNETTKNTTTNYYLSKHLQSFLSHDICFTQVLNSEYMFPINEPYKDIKPFNRETLKSLNVNDETELFIFFINHGFENEFSVVFCEYDDI